MHFITVPSVTVRVVCVRNFYFVSNSLIQQNFICSISILKKETDSLLFQLVLAFSRVALRDTQTVKPVCSDQHLRIEKAVFTLKK